MTNASPEITATGILGRQLKISQIAVVCNDLQKTMENYQTCSGGGRGTCTGTNPLSFTTPRSVANQLTTACLARRRRWVTLFLSWCNPWKARVSIKTG